MADKKATKTEEPKEKVEKKVVATKAKATKATEKPKEVEEVVAEEAPKAEKATAKAGKRSEKALKEVEQKVAKEERKAKHDTTPQGDAESKSKPKAKPTRSRLERRGKNYRKAAEQIEKGKAYSLKEALELATKTSVGKFDSTVEVHLNLNVDPRLADQNIRGTVSLPNGTGKKIRVAVFASADQQEKAKKAGADIVGEEDFLAQLEKEQLNFDILISTPQLMPKLGKYAKLLGPRGLMPNPKSGTVTANVAKAVEEAKAGKVEYRVDKQSIVHQGIGKVSFGADKLYANAKTFVDNVNGNKPASVKGALLKSVAVSTTMGPGIKVDSAKL
jgi:large subunit ribosomal protein L1